MESKQIGQAGNTQPVLGGRYQVCAGLGRGATSNVYLVFDLHERTWVAAKVLTVAEDDRSLLQRFVREGRVMSQLSHPNIVRVLDADYEAHPPFMVMELLAGGSVADWVRANGAMPPALALQAVLDLCDGLAPLHAVRGIHRDVKPQNLLIGRDGRCRLADFGIARVDGVPALEAEHPLTEVGTVMGTLAFMAPEQRIDARNVDQSADVYGVGSTLFTILAGRAAADLSLLDETDRRLASIPSDLRQIILRACAYEPADRYPDVAALRADLADISPPTLPRGTVPLTGQLRDLPAEPPLLLGPKEQQTVEGLLAMHPSSPTMDKGELEDDLTEITAFGGRPPPDEQIDVVPVPVPAPVPAPAPVLRPARPARSSRLWWWVGGLGLAAVATVFLAFAGVMSTSFSTLIEAQDRVHEAQNHLYALLDRRLINGLEARGADRAPLDAEFDTYQKEWSEPGRMAAARRLRSTLQSAAMGLDLEDPGDAIGHSLRSLRAAEGNFDDQVRAYELETQIWPAPWVLGLGLVPDL